MEIDNLFVLKHDFGYGVELHNDFKEEIWVVVFNVDEELREELVVLMKEVEQINMSNKNLVVIKEEEEPIMTKLGMKWNAPTISLLI